MFDIKPTNKSAAFDSSKLRAGVNLKRQAQPKPAFLERQIPEPETDFNLAFLFEEFQGRPLRPAQHLQQIQGKQVQAKPVRTPPEHITSFGYQPPVTKKNAVLPRVKKDPAAGPKLEILSELERAMSEPVDAATELAKIGARVHNFSPGNVRSKAVWLKNVVQQTAEQEKSSDRTGNKIATLSAVIVAQSNRKQAPVVYAKPMVTDTRPTLAERKLILEKAASVRSPSSYGSSPASREVELWLESIKKNKKILSPPSKKFQTPKLKFGLRWPRPAFPSPWPGKQALVFGVGLILAALLVFGLVKKSSVGVKNNVLQNGNNAVANLEDAKHDLENFDFLKAADSFALAYDDFDRASNKLSQLGTSFLSMFGAIPGLDKVRAANNLVAAGQSISKAGENLSLAFGTLYKTNLLSALDTSSGEPKSVSKLLDQFREILLFADKNINKAQHLLADINPAVIPEDKRQLFVGFKEKIPQFQKYIGSAIDYSEFLLKFVGESGTKTYLVLLQNNSELRPTGGFPGTYALLTFDKGSLKKIFVDDVYQLDANIKQSIIPPKQLQHITVNWGLRDANWFADFPTSARKIEEFFKLDGGLPDGQIDGVLTITPDVISKIFDIIGPIDMPEYGLELDSSNFLAQIQDEVEYKADRSKPKKIVTDLQPRFFERLAKQDKGRWLEIFKVLLDAAREKHILAYFNNSDLEKVAVKNDFAGEVKSSLSSGRLGDYLQVVFANVRGSKSDFVTDNRISLKVAPIEDSLSGLENELKISRAHHGGNSKYGFYNRENPAYLKIYVPRGAKLESIEGHTLTGFKPLINYKDFGFKKDSDLDQIEKDTTHPFAGVDVFEESGRTVFGFWLVTRPKETKSVVLKYQVPIENAGDSYHLLWQKQSGTDNSAVNFSFRLPKDKKPSNYSPDLQLIGSILVLDSNLSADKYLDIDLK